MLKTIAKVFLVALIGIGFTTMAVSANADKGQKIILSKIKIKKACHFNGAELAKKHTQSQWEAIYNGEKLADELKTICPSAKPLKKKYAKDVYDFVHKYASDSGNVPS